MLPEKSTARTSNVCAPTLSPVTTCGLEQGAKSPASVLSRRHWNSTGLALSEPVKRNVAEVCSVGLTGAAEIVVVGGIASAAAGGPPSQTTLWHCIGSSVIGSTLPPVLPVAKLPPPSRLTPAMVPSAA